MSNALTTALAPVGMPAAATSLPVQSPVAPAPQAQDSSASASTVSASDLKAAILALQTFRLQYAGHYTAGQPKFTGQLLSQVSHFMSMLYDAANRLKGIYLERTQESEDLAFPSNALYTEPDRIPDMMASLVDTIGQLTTFEAKCRHDQDKQIQAIVQGARETLKTNKGIFDESLRIVADARTPQGAASEQGAQAMYNFEKKLGQGAYGVVRCAEPTSSHFLHGTPKQLPEKVAHKFIDKIFEYSTPRKLLREIKILRLFSHPNIVRLLSIDPLTDPNTNSVALVFEHVETDLARLLSSTQSFTSEHVKYFLYQILLGLEHIHSAGVIHRDLKPQNILLNANCDTKICDFGFARLPPNSQLIAQQANMESSSQPAASASSAADQDELMTEYVATRFYRAPEIVVSPGEYSYPMDMWSVGCIFAELIRMWLNPAKKPTALFPANGYIDLTDKIFAIIGTPTTEEISQIKLINCRNYIQSLRPQKPIDLFKFFSEWAGRQIDNTTKTELQLAVDLLQKILVFDPRKRFTASQALKHSYFKGYVRDRERLFFDCKKYTSSTPASEWDFEKQNLTTAEWRKLIHNEITAINKT